MYLIFTYIIVIVIIYNYNVRISTCFINKEKEMKLNEYQKIAKSTAVYPDGPQGVFYLTLGLCGETGEVAEKIKKVIRDSDSFYEGLEKKKGEIKKELGDVLWYLASISNDLGFTLEEVAKANIEKLGSRSKRGKLHGSGDNR